MNSQQIRINTATAQEIGQLYDVGPDLAQRIVSYRAAHGPFRGPEDLAKVEGIRSDLAYVLAPHIDWHVPEKPEPLEERSWFLAIFFLVVFVPIAYWLADTMLNRWRIELGNTSQGIVGPGHWNDVWILLSMTGVAFFILPAMVVQMVQLLTRSPLWARRLRQAGTTLVALVLLCVISLGLANAVHYQFYAFGGWSQLIHNTPAVVALVVLILISLNYWPIILPLLKPELAYSPLLARIYDITAVLYTPALALAVWAFRSEMPIWVLLAFGLSGLTNVLIGVRILLGYSPYKDIVEATVTERPRRGPRAPRISAERQEALKLTMDEEYQPSQKWYVRLFKGGIVGTAGTWLVTTVVNKIASMMFGPIIEKWINELMEYFGVTPFI